MIATIRPRRPRCLAALGAARARRRTLAAGSGPPLAARRLRFAIL